MSFTSLTREGVPRQKLSLVSIELKTLPVWAAVIQFKAVKSGLHTERKCGLGRPLEIN